MSGCPVRGSGLTGHIVPDAHGGQGDDHEVDGLQTRPALDVLEDHGGDGDEEDAARQDEEQRGRHTDLSLADLVVFTLGEREREGER